MLEFTVCHGDTGQFELSILPIAVAMHAMLQSAVAIA